MSLPYQILNDEPLSRLTDDLLSQKTLVEEIAETVGNRATPPFVASVTGDWGQGKTSLLRSVFERLTGHAPFDSGASPGTTTEAASSEYSHVRVIWFEAWRYQHEQNPIVALLNEIRRQFSLISRGLSFAKKELHIALESSLLALDGLTSVIGAIAGTPEVKTGGIISTIKKTGAAWEQQNLAYSLPSETIREVLNKTINDLLDTLAQADPNNTVGTVRKRLVIIIDDLDRCQPTTTYRFLEGIKIFLNLPSCSVLLGTNRRELERSVAVGLALDSGLDNLSATFIPDETITRLACEYHEKICSFAWDLPFPTQEDVAGYLDKLLTKALPDTTESLALRDQVKGVIVRKDGFRIVPANPRRLKAFVNTLLRIAHLGGQGEDATPFPDEDIALVIVLASVSTFHPEVFRQFLADPLRFESLRSWVISSWDELPILLPDRGEPARESAPWRSLPCTAEDILYTDPGSTRPFRMAPVMSEMGPVTVDQLNRYLRHAR